MLPLKVKAIIAAIITIIIVVLLWLYAPKEKTEEAPLPMGNTIYVQSNSPGECRAIITTILDGKKPAPTELPCKAQLRSKK